MIPPLTLNATSRPFAPGAARVLVRPPDVVTFDARCPVDESHVARWTQSRDDSRTRSEVSCPACGTDAAYLDKVPGQPERGADDGAGDGPESLSAEPLAALGAEFTPVEGAA